MIEARHARASSEGGQVGAEAATADQAAPGEDPLAELVATLDRACEELFAVVPFPGDQSTGASVNAYIDDVVASLRTLRADADDLRRVIAIARTRSRGGS